MSEFSCHHCRTPRAHQSHKRLIKLCALKTQSLICQSATNFQKYHDTNEAQYLFKANLKFYFAQKYAQELIRANLVDRSFTLSEFETKDLVIRIANEMAVPLRDYINLELDSINSTQ